MDIVISFFRDFLDGPLYIAVVVIGVILICAGIGYFAEKSQLRKKKEQELQNSYVSVSDPREQNSSFNTQSNATSLGNNTVPSNVVSGRVENVAMSQMTNSNVLNNHSVPNSNVVQSPVQNVAINNNSVSNSNLVQSSVQNAAANNNILNNANGNQNNQ